MGERVVVVKGLEAISGGGRGWLMMVVVGD